MRPQVPGPRASFPSKNAPAQMDRIEWQLNQIRINTTVVALFFLLALIGAVLVAAGD